jgi:hypothetical protein
MIVTTERRKKYNTSLPGESYAVEACISRTGDIVEDMRIGRRVSVACPEDETQPSQTTVKIGQWRLGSCREGGEKDLEKNVVVKKKAEKTGGKNPEDLDSWLNGAVRPF